MDAKLKIYPEKIKFKIEKKIYGHFIEHLGRCIENGIWSYKDTKIPFKIGRIREDIFDAMNELRPPILRWPGGCFSDTYHWRDGIGKRGKRPLRINRAWCLLGPWVGPLERNHFGTDEFLSLCELLNCEPYINVNFGSGTPDESANWVKYTNKRKDSIKVKYWGIANEIFGYWEIGYCKNGKQYAEKYLKFYKAMKSVDENIKIIAVGADVDTYPKWNREFLEIAGDCVDYLSIHAYAPALTPFDMLFGWQIKKEERNYYSILSASIRFEEILKRFYDSITEVIGENTKIKIAFDEWNLWWAYKQIYQATDYTLRDGLFTASVLNILQKSSNIVGMANFAQMVNTIGLIITNDDGLYLTPSGLAFKLYRDNTLPLLSEFDLTCDTYSSSKLGNIPSYSNIPYLDCSVTVDEDKSKVSVFVVNKHFSKEIKTLINFDDFVPSGKVIISEITSNSPFDMNDFRNKEKIKISKKEKKIIRDEFKYSFLPHSITNLVFNINLKEKN